MKQMLLFAHMGVTLGLAWLPSRLLEQQNLHAEKTSMKAKEGERSQNSPLSRALSYARQLDYRILLVGSLLPDIIDQSTSLLFPNLNSPRGFAHSLLFAITILVVSLCLNARLGNFKGVPLAFGTLVHLILDQMWLLPHTLLWPVYGWGFEGSRIVYVGSFWGNLIRLLRMLLSLLIISQVYFTFEIIGALILVAFFLKLARQRRLGILLKTGSVY